MKLILIFWAFYLSIYQKPSFWNSAHAFICYFFTVGMHKIMLSSTSGSGLTWFVTNIG